MSERLVRMLHAAYAGPADGASDADLLARVAAGKDDAAFELLVRRHAALVWRVCRQVARDHHAAEDAFQATFLALARRAAGFNPAVLRERSAAGWLYRVAYHAALKARATAPPPDGGVEPRRSPGLPPDREAELSELGPVLHAELNRLPDRYRVPLVLCHLEGFTQAEAAARLGWPVGTVATRVRRGCDRLRERLVRRGVALPAGGVAALLGPDANAVSPNLVVVAAGFGSGAVPGPAVRHLAKGALSAMSGTKTKAVALSVAAVFAAVGGVAWAVGQTPTPKAEGPGKAVTIPTSEPGVKKADPGPSDFFQRGAGFERMKLVGLGMHAHLDAKSSFPADITDKGGRPILSWRVAVLPYVGEEYLFNQFRLDEPWDGEHNKRLLWYVPKVFRTPGAGAERTRVMVFVGPGTVFEPKTQVKVEDITDGTASTILAVEAGPSVPWTKPADLPFDPAKQLPEFHPPFADGFVAAWADGSARWLPPDPDPKWLKLVIQRADGDIAEEPARNPQPPRPLTEQEKKKLDWVKSWFARKQELQKRQVEERFRLTDELRKAGSPLIPDPPAGDDLWAWTQAFQYLQDTEQSDLHEVSRLWQELEKRDPQAAARLRKELAPAK